MNLLDLIFFFSANIFLDNARNPSRADLELGPSCNTYCVLGKTKYTLPLTVFFVLKNHH
jgi:hypothetical protein